MFALQINLDPEELKKAEQKNAEARKKRSRKPEAKQTGSDKRSKSAS